jgi:NAD(P)-dependent dehydrogenase (short-subunit alcohol dehydrogenase family)
MAKIALVTGGSRGLGKDMSLSLARAGIDVVLTFNQKQEDANNVVAEIEKLGRKAATLQLNTGVVSTFAEFEKSLLEVLKKVWNTDKFDFLVNNAGIDCHTLIGSTTEQQFDSLMNVHFKGVYFLTQQLLPHINNNGGAIVNISTGLTRFSIPGYGAYASMKGAIEVFTKYLAKELGSRGIRANIVAPGAIETDFTRGSFEHKPEIKNFLASQTALGRVGQPTDIGSVVAFLCSDSAKWVNAQRIEASGGMFL